MLSVVCVICNLIELGNVWEILDKIKTPTDFIDSKPEHKGVNHWIIQRLSAMFLLPFLLFLLLNIISLIKNGVYGFSQLSVFGVLSLLLAIGMMLLHGSIGFEVIIEDYVQHGILRKFLIFSSYALSLITFVSLLFALIILFV